MKESEPINPPTSSLPQPEEMLITPEATPEKTKLTFILLGIFVILLISACAFFVIKTLKKPTVAPRPQLTPISTPTPDETTDWRTYNNNLYNFSLKYPSSWKIWEYSTPDEPNLVKSYDLIINPSDVDPYSSEYPRYFHLRIDKGDLNGIRNQVRKNSTQEKSIIFSGISAFEYTYSNENDSNRKYKEIDFVKDGFLYQIYTQFYSQTIEKIFTSFSI